MKPLTAAAALATGRPYAEPGFVGRLDFFTPSPKTLWISTEHIPSFLGQEILAFVADWGTLDEALNTLNADGRPATAEIALVNTKPIEGKSRMSGLIRTALNQSGSYEWAFATLTIFDRFETVLGVFYLEDPTEIGEVRLTVRMSDQSLVLEDAMRSSLVTRDLFPTVSLDLVGRRIPWLVGVLKDVPCMPVNDGLAGALSGSHTAATTTITFVDATGFTSGDKILVGAEIILLGSPSGNSFTGSTRSSDATEPSLHEDGSEVLQLRNGANAYRFIPGAHDPIYQTKSVTNIKVDGLPARTGPTVSLDEGWAIGPGNRGPHINFTVSDLKKFHLDPIQGARTQDSARPSTHSITWEGPESDRTIGVLTLDALTGSELGRPRVSRTLDVQYKITTNAGINSGIVIKIGGRAALMTPSTDIPATNTVIRGSFTYDTGQSLDAETCVINFGSSGSSTISVTINAYTAIVSPGARSGVRSTTGRCIGTVTCDLEGIKDDVAGSISGTPNLLLENPADLAKLFLTRTYPGPTLAELGPTFAATRASLAAAGYTWAFLLDYTEFSKLRRKLGEQARSVLYLEGAAWEFKFLPDAPAAQKTLDYERDVWKQMPAQVSRTPRHDVHNSLYAYSQRDYRKSGGLEDRYRRVKHHTDGAADLRQDLELDFIQDAATADAVGAFWLAQWKRQHLIVNLIAWWNVLAMEKVDHLSLINHPLLEEHGGAALVFRIVEKAYLAGAENPGRIRLRAVEV